MKFPHWVTSSTRFAGKWWFPPFVALMSALDAYVLVVPNEPLIVAAVLANPKRWFSVGVWSTIGSAVGALSLALLVSYQSQWILDHFVTDKMLHSEAWEWSVRLMKEHGVWSLALISLSPVPQHAAVIFSGLAKMPAWQIFVGVLMGRTPKYLGAAFLAAKSPGALKKIGLWPKAESST